CSKSQRSSCAAPSSAAKAVAPNGASTSPTPTPNGPKKTSSPPKTATRSISPPARSRRCPRSWRRSSRRRSSVMTDEQLQQHIELNPNVMVGKPVIRGTRIPVELVIRLLAQGISESEVLQQYPQLQPEDIRAALLYAA